MPLDIQSGELADRLRRFFRLTGRIPTVLDETLVPTVNVQDLDQPPWRSRSNDACAAVAISAVAAEVNACAIAMAPAASGRFVLDSILVKNTTAAIRDLSIAYLTTAFVTGIQNVVQVPNVEVPGPFQPVAPGVLPRLGLTTCTYHQATVNGEIIGRISVPIGETFRWENRLTLMPGWQIAVWHETVNQDLRVTFHGTHYPDAQL